MCFGRAISHRQSAEAVAQASIEIAMGAAEASSNWPMIGPTTAARVMFRAPIREAATPESVRWFYNASTWPAGMHDPKVRV